MFTLPSFSENSLNLLMDLIHQRTGHSFENSKWDRLVDKLTPLVVERGFNSFLDYYYLLKYDPQAEPEWRRVESALAVNESYFWREFDQIRAVAEILAPEFIKNRPGQPLRIWHAGCATGEEPYTMAIALEEAGCYRAGDIELFGSDFNDQALALARAALFRQRSFRAVPAEILERYFLPGPSGQMRLVDSIRNRVKFTRINLVDEAGVAQMRNMDIIFCRNVFIYFSNTAIHQTVSYLHRSLKEPGYLFVAAAESLLKITTLFELGEVGSAFVYKKLKE